MDAWEASAWALKEYGGADLGHGARTKRLVQVGAALIRSPAVSIPKTITDPAQAKAAYRFMSNPEVTGEGILSGHTQATGRKCLGRDAVLVLQDTTTLKFHSRAGFIGLGPINDVARTQGFLAHTSLAVERETHDILGVLHQHTWVRSKQKKPAKETAAQRKKRARESEHWGDNQRRVAQVLKSAAGDRNHSLPRVIAVFDREGDIFEALETLDELGHSFVIRAARNRLLDSEGDAKRYSLDEVRTARVVAHKKVDVRARAGHGARVAMLEVRAMTVSIRPPSNRVRHGESLTVNVVLAEERDAPVGADPLCWFLVTREPIATPEDVLQIIQDYVARWIVEEFHMGLKTGCACEDRQMETAHALQNFLALATPMACQLLQIRDVSRRDTPVEQCSMVGPSEMAVLRGLRPRAMAKVTTARQLMRVIANFGGFLNRNNDPDPGWRTLWRGFEEVKLAARGYDLHARIESLDRVLHGDLLGPRKSGQ
jgi:hypothetical protein